MPSRMGLMALGLLVWPWLAVAQPEYTNPTLPGDHPDPSIIRVGQGYWATATTSHWAPVFPIMYSRDLVNWEQTGAVFERPPAWSAGSYWAPEIGFDGRRFLVYYTARRKGGPLCVAVATATAPDGPYRDRGPLVCQEAGSIDAMATADEQGRRYLIWKEDGNSRKRPTPLWAQRLSADGTKLVGRRYELLRNETAWEAHVIEAPFILRRGGWFYLFYSGDACCGRACNYQLGVARARALLGPWERNPGNPILSGNAAWKCPGHGSIVSTPDGRDYLLYHAYQPDSLQLAGRQGLLDEVVWGADDWPVINGGRGPTERGRAPAGVSARERRDEFLDELEGPTLQRGWQWPWDRYPARRFGAGSLELRTSARGTGSAVDTIVARPALSGDYTVTVRVAGSGAARLAMSGLAAYVDADNAMGISRRGADVILWVREKGLQRELARGEAGAGPSLDLRLNVVKGRLRFEYSAEGLHWRPLEDEADGNYPALNRAVRVALAVGGAPESEGRFDWIRIETR